jgi:hypothetical protein
MNGCTLEALPVFSSVTQRECHHRVRTPTCTHRSLLFTDRILPDSPKLIPQKLIVSVSAAACQIWGFKTYSTCGIAAESDCPEVDIVCGKSDGSGIPPRAASCSLPPSRPRIPYRKTVLSTPRNVPQLGITHSDSNGIGIAYSPSVRLRATPLPSLPVKKTEDVVPENVIRM